MSELMNTTATKTILRWQLLTTVSALAVLITAGAGEALAQDTDRPTVWIELGAGLERINRDHDLFIPDFIPKNEGATPFDPVSPIKAQTPPRYGLSGEAKLTFEPAGSHWVFAAGLRYGRSNGKKEVHQQTFIDMADYFPPSKIFGSGSPTQTIAKFATTKTEDRQSYVIADFQAGKDVGLGMFGNNGSSVMSFGVRFAQFTSRTKTDLKARPTIDVVNRFDSPQFTQPPIPTFFPSLSSKYFPSYRFNAYSAYRDTTRNFSGVGPSLSWTGSTPIAGRADENSISFDWGINGAILFGRQKVRDRHQQTARHYDLSYVGTEYPSGEGTHYNVLYKSRPDPQSRSHSVTVPNIGGFAGISFKMPNAKVSFGYRADVFFGAMDGGIDTRHTRDMIFHGPFAKFSIGL
jgi:hypothetical protein